MTIKRVRRPERVRQVPAQFSWVDHCLVRERYLERCDPLAAPRYLFLITVARLLGGGARPLSVAHRRPPEAGAGRSDPHRAQRPRYAARIGPLRAALRSVP